jgi:ABC-2 type transport system ATP-binding protein
MLIEARHLQKRFGPKEAVTDLSVAVDGGEIYGLVGPDGAGKTTTMRLICGALKMSGGRVRLGGFDMSRKPDHGRALLGYLPQRFSLYEELTVLENLRFFAETRGLPAREWRPRSQEILQFVGLAPFGKRRAGHLSGGMRQKLGLAAALVHRPRILLLDEPTTGVDPVTRQDFWQLIISLVATEGVAVLITTPYMDEAARCHRLGFMRLGSLLIEGTPVGLQEMLAGQVIELQGRPLPQLRHLASAVDGVESVQAFGDRLHLRVGAGQSEQVITRLRAMLQADGITLTVLQEIQPQLEDVFMALLERGDLAAWAAENGLEAQA